MARIREAYEALPSHLKGVGKPIKNNECELTIVSRYNNMRVVVMCRAGKVESVRGDNSLVMVFDEFTFAHPDLVPPAGGAQGQCGS